MENLSFTLGTVINLGGFLLIGSGLYWKLQLNVKEIDNRAEAREKEMDLQIRNIDAKIANIKKNREDAWAKHNDEQERSNAIHVSILKGISDIKGNVKQVQTDVEWLKRK